MNKINAYTSSCENVQASGEINVQESREGYSRFKRTIFRD